MEDTIFASKNSYRTVNFDIKAPGLEFIMYVEKNYWDKILNFCQEKTPYQKWIDRYFAFFNTASQETKNHIDKSSIQFITELNSHVDNQSRNQFLTNYFIGSFNDFDALLSKCYYALFAEILYEQDVYNFFIHCNVIKVCRDNLYNMTTQEMPKC